MGGYFAPRAVAYEKRITALIANSLLPELKTLFAGNHWFDPKAPSPEGAVDLTTPFKVYAGVVRERLGMAGGRSKPALTISPATAWPDWRDRSRALFWSSQARARGRSWLLVRARSARS
jgi:hypothetical protein